MFRSQKTEAWVVLLAGIALFASVNVAAQRLASRESHEHAHLVKGRVLARHAGLRDGLGNYDVHRLTFLFGAEPEKPKIHSLRPLKIIYEYIYPSQELPDSFFDYSIRYQLRVARDTTCDETLDSFSYEEAADQFGKPLGRDYVLRLLEGAPKEILKPDLLLPCYVLTPGNYKVVKNSKETGALKLGDRSQSFPLSGGYLRLPFPVWVPPKQNSGR